MIDIERGASRVGPGAVQGWVRTLAGTPPGTADGDDAQRVDLLRSLEELKCAAEALQAVVAVELDTSVRAEEGRRGLPTHRQGRGVASQLALARRESPYRGRQHLGLAKVLAAELPHTLAAFRAGRITEWRATLVARETACLTREHRREVDADVAAEPDRLEAMGDGELVAALQRLSYRLDPGSAVARRRRGEADRRVSLRPAPDVMSQLSALLPVKDGVAVFAALTRQADALVAAGDGRGRGQIMADTLVDRVLGRALRSSLTCTDPVAERQPAASGDDRPGDAGAGWDNPGAAAGPADACAGTTGNAGSDVRAGATSRTGADATAGAGASGARCHCTDRASAGSGARVGADAPGGAGADVGVGAGASAGAGAGAGGAGAGAGGAGCARAHPGGDGAGADGPTVVFHVVVSDQVLLGTAAGSAHLDGYGVIPADLARELATEKAWVRRLYRRPETGELVAADARSRRFPPRLTRLIRLRDQRCRTPWCDAPVRHIDHVLAYLDGGATSLENGQGLCEACNYAKEAPGWTSRPEPGPRHTVRTTTPTGHRHPSTAPSLGDPSGTTHPAPTAAGREEDWILAS